MSVNIHGNEYITVAERVQTAHKDITGQKKLSITTEVLYQEPVVVKATVTTDKGVFTGISAANPNKTIEKQSPYEVAETSAVGRALGFAGYGIVEGIATADEMKKVEPDPTDDFKGWKCSNCGDTVTAKVHDYSTQKYGKDLCFKCQKKATISPSSSGGDKS